MRLLLGVLRRDDEHSPERASQPTLAEVHTLVAAAEDAGVRATLDVRGEPVVLQAGVELAAYRLVQEALTNVVKHAGPAQAQVTIAYEPDRLRVQIVDDGRGHAATHADTPGHGLIGMAERVDVYHGTFSAGPRAGGGYAVEAVLPLEAPAGRSIQTEAAESPAGVPDLEPSAAASFGTPLPALGAP